MTRTATLAAATAAVLGAVMLSLAVAAANGSAPTWELDVVDAAIDLPEVIGFPMRLVMELGTFPAIFPVALVAWFLTDRWQPALAVAVAGVVAWFVSNRAKVVIERERPLGVDARTVLDSFGYPSGHAAVAFGLATALAPLLGRWRWMGYLVAALVGVARMHVGVHYPLDVVGGALIGAAAGLGVRAVARY